MCVIWCSLELAATVQEGKCDSGVKSGSVLPRSSLKADISRLDLVIQRSSDDLFKLTDNNGHWHQAFWRLHLVLLLMFRLSDSLCVCMGTVLYGKCSDNLYQTLFLKIKEFIHQTKSKEEKETLRRHIHMAIVN